MELCVVMENRRSQRAFDAGPVEKEVIEELLRRAGRAPSALNLQPWEVTVVMGDELARLTRRLLRAYRERAAACTPGASRPLPEVFQSRRRASFAPLVQLLNEEGIELDAFVGKESCRFYGAPAAIIICMDGAFPKDRYICIGTFLGYLLLAAHDMGLATCPVGLVAAYQDEIRDQLNIPDGKEVVIGVALGRPNESSPLSHFVTPRDPLAAFVRWFV